MGEVRGTPEMYIREDLVYEKQTGNLISFANLGDVSNHLLAYEEMLEGEQNGEWRVAKTMDGLHSVAKALTLVVGDEASETAKFVSMFDSFWDILNAHEWGLEQETISTALSPHSRQKDQGV